MNPQQQVPGMWATSEPDCTHEDTTLVSVVKAPSGVYFTTDQPEFCISRSTIVRKLGTAKGVTIDSALECEACGHLSAVEFDIDNDGCQVVTAVSA